MAAKKQVTQSSDGAEKRLENLKPFKAGQSGNPGGQAKGLARYSRECVGEDGNKLADFWVTILEDENADLKLRLEASKLLADRAFGKPIQTLEHGGTGGPIVVRLAFDPDA